ncbi:MAG: hypothetical protein P8008_07220, partial [Gammaproteobacteria bacterium]
HNDELPAVLDEFRALRPEFEALFENESRLDARLARLNAAIETGEVRFVGGEPVTAPLQEALITEDGKVIYPVEDEIPVLLEEQGIGTTQLQDF